MTDNNRTLSITEDKDWKIPIADLLTGRTFITGKSGSGKSNTASVMVEELLDQGFPILIIDTDGEYWGLKQKYEILHVGGDEECDLQVGSQHAAKLAELALDQNVPIILDISGYIDEEDANDLIKETARHLFAKEKKLKKPFLLLVEEIHEYIPEKGSMDDTGKMLIKIGKRGRKHGLGLAGMSQRPADVKKDFITQCDLVFWHRLTWSNDTDVVRRVINSETANAIEDIDDGETFVTGDDVDFNAEKMQIRRKQTHDAGATPSLEEVERPDLKSVSDDLVHELEEISDRQAQREDKIAQLEAENDELREQIEELEQELSEARDLSNMADTFAESILNLSNEEPTGEGTTEINRQLSEIVEENNELKRKLKTRKERIKELEAKIEALRSEKEELEQAKEINFETVEEAIKRLTDELDIKLPNDANRWRQKYQQERDRREQLEKESKPSGESNDESGVTGPSESPNDNTNNTIPSEYESFLNHDYVTKKIQEAKEKKHVTPKYVTATVRLIVQHGGGVSRKEIADDVGIKTPENIGKAMRALSNENVVELSGTGSQQTADFDFDSLENQRQADAVIKQAGITG